ncbi:MAG: 5-formyltetrahydrofolate cyclo-ligase [Phycisphaerales bacterium]
MSGTRMSKAAIRGDVRARLASIDAARAQRELEQGLAELEGSSLWAHSPVVMGYLATEDEASVDGVLSRAIARGHWVTAPRMDWDARTMEPRILHSLTQVEVRRHGVREPLESCEPAPADDIALVLVPGVAFDRAGGRLGRGAGFYDRFLATLPASVVKIGVCHAAQVVEEIPMETHDVRLDGLVAGGGLMLLSRDAGSEA